MSIEKIQFTDVREERACFYCGETTEFRVNGEATYQGKTGPFDIFICPTCFRKTELGLKDGGLLELEIRFQVQGGLKPV